MAIFGYKLATGFEVIHTRLSKGITLEAIVYRKMDQDEVLELSAKLRGLGYLLAQERNAYWQPEDISVIREGIGLLVLDLGRQLAGLALEQDQTIGKSSHVSSTSKHGVRK